ncbi:haloacid dehalogenase [Marinobacterium zhoushanense]|uniref:Haloacid dehalogenase-like hydrolase domain-containing protein 2 n=1 Tax=Marinobacterium zhoushanense TaxID=1679163 RepID=A0ABQ1K7D6_9GAMM|nr:TIGR01458 family HAD-type hydrolase [Marinobacterium zhoushanense]GGB90732.1 haloacid dehalogenase [Marinobacterium zhoushanense]
MSPIDATAQTISMPKGLLLDLDGVLYVDDALIPGAITAIEWLNSHQLPFRYITNTSTKTRDQLLAKLDRLGLPARAEQVFSAVQASEAWLEAQSITRIAALVSESVRLSLEERFELDESTPEAVLIGDIGEAWNYSRLNQAFHWLLSGAKLVCVHRNRYWRTGEALSLDIGAFVAALEYAADIQSIVIGKPSAAFFDAACASMSLSPGEVMVIGDDVETDVGGGQSCGCRGVLVETGKFQPDLVARSAVVPDYQIPSIAELPALLGGGAGSGG